MRKGGWGEKPSASPQGIVPTAVQVTHGGGRLGGNSRDEQEGPSPWQVVPESPREGGFCIA